MPLFEDYTITFYAILLMLWTVLIQWLIASGTKAKQPGAIPGRIDPGLSHDSFVFRSHRTFMNSLENMPLMLLTIITAILLGTSPEMTGILSWIYAISRLGHMALYYRIATEKNPSPRSYFFMAGLLANIFLLMLCTIKVFT